MPSPLRMVLVCSVLAACEGGTSGPPSLDAGPPCVPSAESETMCGDGVDEDCDGLTDCLDPSCDGLSCGAGELACFAGGCLDGVPELPELPRIEGVRTEVRGDTALVHVPPLEGARDYRVYPLPADDDILAGADGELVIRDAIYRCGGDRPRPRRDQDGLPGFELSLAGSVRDYTRAETESLLGFVYATPDAGRVAVHRVANPNVRSGFVWPHEVEPGQEYVGGVYVTDLAERDALLAAGWRDDGIAFYVPESATRRVFTREYGENGSILVYTEGPEHDARAADSDSQEVERFRVLAAEEPGSLPLYRVFYAYGSGHDVLAVGAVGRDRALHQGNVPLTTLAWPGLTGSTTLVVEALDQGCPFPGGYLGATSARAEPLGGVPTAPTITLDEARLPSGEVFVNGQHDPANRPRPIARAFVTVEPLPHPEMDWFMSFDEPMSPMTRVYEDGNLITIEQNEVMSFEHAQGGTVNRSYGSLLGQLVTGSSSSYTILARGADARVEAGSFLHATMSVDIPSTNRRYPQIMISTTPIDPDEYRPPFDVTFLQRLGPIETSDGDHHTIIVQTFGGSSQLQIQFCDRRGWGVSAQCPQANIYGYHVGQPAPEWESPWLPVPALGDLAGADRPVRFDVYASTERVYVYVEGRPTACAVLPAGRMPAGGVSVAFGVAAYHIEIDEHVVPESSQHQYWRRHSVAHTDRRLDDLGVDSGVSLPGWDESVLPCATRFFNGALAAM